MIVSADSGPKFESVTKETLVRGKGLMLEGRQFHRSLSSAKANFGFKRIVSLCLKTSVSNL